MYAQTIVRLTFKRTPQAAVNSEIDCRIYIVEFTMETELLYLVYRITWLVAVDGRPAVAAAV